MAKRFIDTGIFRKPSIRAMKAPYKALFIYLLCECDHAGVWDVELDIAAMRLGMDLDAEVALQELGGSVVALDGGRKWLLSDFVEYQYGELNPANRVHASVISRLESLNVKTNEKAKKKGLVSPLQGAKDKDKDKDKVTELEEKERARIDTPEAFRLKCAEVVASDPTRLPLSERAAFLAYWTEANPKTGKMRFEAEHFFDVGRRMDTWRKRWEKDNPPEPAVWNARA